VTSRGMVLPATSALSATRTAWAGTGAAYGQQWGATRGRGGACGLETIAAAADAALRLAPQGPSSIAKPSFAALRATPPSQGVFPGALGTTNMQVAAAEPHGPPSCGWEHAAAGARSIGPEATTPGSAHDFCSPGGSRKTPSGRTNPMGEFDLDGCGPFRCGCVKGKPELGAPAAVAAAQLTPHQLLPNGGIAPCTDFRGSIVCNETLLTVAELVAHRREAHGVESPPGVCCPLCYREVSCRSHLNRHMRGCHTRDHRWACDECGKSFSSLSNRDAHVRSVHRKTRPFVCRACPRSFSRRTHLRVHCRKVHCVDIGTRTHLVTWADIQKLSGCGPGSAPVPSGPDGPGARSCHGAPDDASDEDSDRGSRGRSPEDEALGDVSPRPKEHAAADDEPSRARGADACSATSTPSLGPAQARLDASTPVVATSDSPSNTVTAGSAVASAAVSEVGDADHPPAMAAVA